ncbi:MFS general substrate transporter [Parathielavia appendiculata]|uniref:MFS general substrate transporter n=1 Tax=Parathielavia appendiculata TaxID=2587402 RepID=A0AAN6YZL9_9PEZI|nr:MFS general substrate transporter [Parathielavia appendiculata]
MHPSMPICGAVPSLATTLLPGAESGESGVDDDAALEGYKLWVVAIGVCFGALMMSLDISIIGTALPSIMSEFGDSTNLAWYPAAFTLATCALTPVAGKMASVFPLDLVYSSFTFVFLVGSIICGCAPVSSALHRRNGLTILVTIAPVTKKPIFMGLGAACFGVGLVFAPLLGGAFTDRLTWRWCFWINIPFNVITLAVISFFFRPKRGRGGGVSGRIQSLDLSGCFIFVPAIFMFLLAMQTGGEDGVWNSATVIGLFVGAGVTLLLFVAWEWRQGTQAMIPGKVVLRRTVVFTCLFAFTHMGALTIASYYLPAWFQVVQGVGPLDSGVRMLPTVITQIVATMAASGLAMRIRYYNPWFFVAPIFMCTSSVLYTTFTTFGTPASHWIGYQVIQGFGAGFGMQMSSLCVQVELKDMPDLVPIGIALVMFMQYLGATVLQVIAGTVFNSELISRLEETELTHSQMTALLGAGLKGMRIVVEKNFPDLLSSVLEAYNGAITRVFFVAVGGAALGFFFAFGIKAKPEPPIAADSTA